jgi:O-antigen ligase
MVTVEAIQGGFQSVRTVRALRSVPPLAISRIISQSVLIIALLLINQAGPAGNILFFAVLGGMIAASPALAFKALTICALGLVCNQAIVLKTTLWAVARFFIPAICLVRFSLDLQTLRSSLFQRSYFIALAAFIAVAAILTIMTQYFVEIALLKLLNFTIFTMAVFGGARVLRVRRIDLTEWYVTLCCVTVLLGIGSMATGIGNNMRGAGTFSSTFNGPFYHSNCLGPMAAMMVVYLICVVIYGHYRNRWLCIGLAACLMYFMALTQSRTSFAAMFAGIIALVGLSFILVRRQSIQLRMKVSRLALVGTLAIGGVGVLIADVMTGQAITKKVVAFANKGGKSEVFDLDQALSSRQSVIQASWHNFLESPLIGIGFEVAKTEYFQKNATLFYAPIEKGFLPVAVLEETGIIGTFFFVVFLMAYLLSLARERNVPGITLFLTFLAVNCGEAMFFGVAGHGGFGWLWFMGGMLLGDACVERIRPPVRLPRPS